MVGEFQDQGHFNQDLEDWLSPRGSQYFYSFFSMEDKQESIRIQDPNPQGSIISNQDTDGGTSTIVVVKILYKAKGYRDNIYSPLCGGLYKEEDNSLVTWSGTDPDAKMNCFNWSKDDNDWIVPEDQYNKEFNSLRGPIHNG